MLCFPETFAGKYPLALRHIDDAEAWDLQTKMTELPLSRPVESAPWAHGGNRNAAWGYMWEVIEFTSKETTGDLKPRLDADSYVRKGHASNLALCKSYFGIGTYDYIVGEYDRMKKDKSLEEIQTYLGGIAALGLMLSRMPSYGDSHPTPQELAKVDRFELLEGYTPDLLKANPDAIAAMMREAKDETLLTRLKLLGLVEGDYSHPDSIRGLPLPEGDSA